MSLHHLAVVEAEAGEVLVGLNAAKAGSPVGSTACESRTSGRSLHCWP